MEDRSWMYNGAGRNSFLYFKNVTAFVEAAKTRNVHMKTNRLWCPCKKCKNVVTFETPETIREHLLKNVSLRTTQYGLNMERHK